MRPLDPSDLLQRLFAALRYGEVDVSAFELDHVCYRVADMGRYEALRTMLGRHGTLLGEHSIGGRPIVTFRLNEPFLFAGRSIEVIELPAPKPGSVYAEGFEHAEFVVDEEPLEFAKRYPLLNWDLSGASKAMNADVRLNYNGFSVKFHQRSLADVIADEERAKR
ncbi:MAG TPA: VOC family protein [Flavobacteriales bacterium]|nr:VOC family protein [Flavobacteriales bacterium]